MYAETNAPYANRIQLVIDPYLGPLYQDGPLGFFDPRRDLIIYVDGVLTPISTFAFDAGNNRYLLYTSTAINLQGVIQVVYHMPSPPFMCQASGSTPATTAGFGYLFGDYFGGELPL